MVDRRMEVQEGLAGGLTGFSPPRQLTFDKQAFNIVDSVTASGRTAMDARAKAEMRASREREARVVEFTRAGLAGQGKRVAGYAVYAPREGFGLYG